MEFTPEQQEAVGVETRQSLAAFYEKRRRQRLAEVLDQERRRWLAAPPVLVEPTPAILEAVQRRDFAGLLPGIELSPGRISVTFTTTEEALEKLLALALAIGQHGEEFEERVGQGKAHSPKHIMAAPN